MLMGIYLVNGSCYIEELGGVVVAGEGESVGKWVLEMER